MNLKNEMWKQTLLTMVFLGLLITACSKSEATGSETDQEPPLRGHYDGPYILYEGLNARMLSVAPGPGGAVTEDETISQADLRREPLKVFPNGRKKDDSRMDPFNVNLFDFSVEEQWDFEQPEKIFAIADIECGFAHTVNILKAGNVIDEDYNWIYGENHLVVNGDMFSRGLDMMALLWLLYKLDYEALAAGGKVHIIIGNHEAMNLRGDVRYVEDRYIDWTNSMGIPYEDLFNEDTELGRWLRSKNTIIRIGRNLIVHGGISPEFVEREITPLEANRLVRRDLGLQTSELEGTSEFVFRTWGPLWYRGMVRIREDREPVFAEDMPPILDYFDVDRFVVGHCKGPEIMKLREKLVVVIDVNHTGNWASGDSRALLIEHKDGEDHLWAVYDSGEKKEVPVGEPVP